MALLIIAVILESNLQADVTQEMFAEGYKVTMASFAANDPMTPVYLPDIKPKSLSRGSTTTLFGALDPEIAAQSGSFLSDGAVWQKALRPHAVGKENQDKLWALSEKLVGQKFVYE